MDKKSPLLIKRHAIRYWGRKFLSHARFITDVVRSRCRPGATILDPFAGSGEVCSWLSHLGYRVVLIDSNLYAHLIQLTRFSRANWRLIEELVESLNSLRLKFIDASGRVREFEWYSLYSAWCPTCRARRVVRRIDYVEGRAIAALTCGHTVEWSEPIPDDWEVADWYPRLRLEYPDGTPFLKRRNVVRVDQLYSKLNLATLAAITRHVRFFVPKVWDEPAAWTILSSIAYNASRMGRYGCGSWAINSYWIPGRRRSEYNPVLSFRRRVSRVKRWNLNYKVSRCWDERSPVVSIWGSVFELEKHVPSERIDLVVTDPPHWDEVQYFELSYLHLSWLLPGLSMLEQHKALNAWRDEVVVNTVRGTSAKRYLKLLSRAFKSVWRVMKPGAQLILMLHEEMHERLEAMLNSITEVGFEIEEEIATTMPLKPIGERGIRQSNVLNIYVLRKPT